MERDKLKEFILTLEIAARELPAEAHPVHRERLWGLRDRFKHELQWLERGQDAIARCCERMTGR